MQQFTNNPNNSVTLTKILRNPAFRAYKLLVKKFGVDVDIYKLKSQQKHNNSLNAFSDDNLDYENDPYLQIKVIIPSLFRRRSTINLVSLDPFIDADNFCYTNLDVSLHLHSLIVGRLVSGKVFNYRVVEAEGTFNDAGMILHRYAIVPVTTLDINKNHDEILYNINIERELNDTKDTFSTTTPNFSATNKFTYEPLK